MSKRSLTPTGDYYRSAGIREFAGVILAVAAAVLATLVVIALGAGIFEAAWVTKGLVIGLAIGMAACLVGAGLCGVRANLMIRDHQAAETQR